MSSSSPKMNQNSDKKKIEGRRTYRTDKNTKEISPFNVREYSISPIRKEKLYPDLKEFHYDDDLRDMSGSETEEVQREIPKENDTSEKQQNYNNYAWCLAILIIAVLMILLLKPSPDGSSQNVTNIAVNDLIDCSHFEELGKKYDNQNAKIFKSLKISTESLYNRKHSRPSVFAFFSTDQNTMDAITKDIVRVTKKCINQSLEPINLSNSDLNKEKFLKDHTKIISEYKNELSKRTIMVINNLDRISTSILPSLHSFADTYNPLVQKSIIYFTIKVPQRPTGKDIDYIFTYLQQKWSDLPNNVRDPLITRILDQTFFLEPSH